MQSSHPLGVAREDRALPLLIVDDDASFLSIVCSALDRAGWEYVVAHSGLRAIQLATRHRFRSVLLDLRLPDLDGLQVLSMLKELPTPPPVVLVSGGGTISSAVAAMRLGAKDFIEKPVPIPDLLDALAAASLNRVPAQVTGEPVERVTALVTLVARATYDVRTIQQWSSLSAMSSSAIRAHCARLGVSAKQALDLGRLLRVALSQPVSPQVVIESVDSRTVTALARRAGMSLRELQGLTAHEFLRRQEVAEHPELLRALALVLPRQGE